jgi:membrane-associated phospholipid phosphatase
MLFCRKVVLPTGTLRNTLTFSLLSLLLISRADAAPSSANRSQAGDENGGNWKPVVMQHGADFSLKAPPGSSSHQQNQELQELLALQSRRTAVVSENVRFWDGRAVVRWNEIARQLVAKNKTLPPVASRVYALVSVAQYDALILAGKNKNRFRRQSPSQLEARLKPVAKPSGEAVYPSEAAVVAGASAAVLQYAFPDETTFIQSKVQEHAASRLWGGANFRSDLNAGDELGRQIGQLVVRYAQSDGADAQWTGSIPTGPDKWNGTNPVLPLWGKVRPWLISDVAQLRPPPPPAFDSPQFKAALAEVRRISDTRTPEQLRIAQFWADGAGTYTPPGHWNDIACGYIVERDLSELRAARALALMNMAVMDAGICCWDAKYFYWLLRPFQADPAITTPVGKPNFPAYTSGHATFSGAASEVLAFLFPHHKKDVRRMAEEAALSRLYGGIHYNFDNTVGLEAGQGIGNDRGLKAGRRIALSAIQRGMNDGSPTEP